MKEYFQYHNVKTQGEWKSDTHAYSKKRIDDCMGNRIWVIANEGKDNYVVASCFIVEKIEEKDGWINYFGARESIPSGYDISSHKWFREFFDSVGRGAFGLSCIKDAYASKFQTILMNT